MRPTLTILILISLQNIGFAQLLSSIDERQLPGKFERTAKVPANLARTATLTFVDSSVIFDGGSYGARFRRDNGHGLVIYFLHPGYWTKQAIKNKTQPIVVDLYQNEEKVKLEVEPDSPLEKRIIELLNDDLSKKELSDEQVKTLTRVRDCIRDREPHPEIRERFRATFTDSR